MKLVKYFPPQFVIKSIMEGLFKVSKSAELNDVFDCDGTLTPNLPPPSLLGSAHRNLDDTVIWMCRAYDVIKGKNIVDNNYRIMCFREFTGIDTKTDILFWAHYADSSKGARVIFDITPELYPTCILKKVKYSPTPATCNLSLCKQQQHDPNLMQFMEDRIFTKSSSWDYEQEYRLCIPLNRETEDSLTIKDGMAFLKINHTHIRGIDFGARFEQDRRREAIAQIQACPTLRHVRIRCAEPTPDCQFRYIDASEIS